ncbi:Efflux pump periplasmic linker BepD precursor [Rubripirellula amarantea]|uniref:Efflux pump periplasmic linker BepD n=1 Tax=Rubripirellula amarantea TaxID=2527999 RepID=A0A5C5WLX7_9BACT|nr:efflux RND transporter periplasmic adaptor subunit [Rubripirellula amarantea]TWT51139.1 Efflux pump periplasmic linker BepD precursor [Rubripirellula amarantea]
MRNNLVFAVIVAVASLSMSGVETIKETYQTYFASQESDGEVGSDSHRAATPLHASDHEDGGHDNGGHKEGDHHAAGEHHAQHKIVVTNPVSKDVTLTQQYVCQIHSRRHIEICALEGGYLNEIGVGEGQSVKRGQSLFRILPTLLEAKLEADRAEASLAQVEYDNTQSLVQQNIVSPQELKLANAKLAKAMANVKLAQAEMNFADIKAPFDGIVDRLHEQEGSLIEEGAMLTTMSDNSVMWVYFNVPEARYLEYQTALGGGEDQSRLNVQLKLANHKIFEQPGRIGAIEADFDSETGNIAFRADFPNPNGLLRHGQTGTVQIHKIEKDAIVIPQRATFEILAKKYAYVVDADNVVHQREITIKNEKDDIFIIENGLSAGDRIVLEGIRQVRDGERFQFEFVQGEAVLANLKYHAE